MSGHIPTHKPKLLVVSDTAIYELNNQKFGFGPVVRELEHLSDAFETITWIGYLKKGLIGDPIMRRIQRENINLILIPASGGDRFIDKIDILWHLPATTLTILSGIFKHDCIHTRGPSVPALITLLLSFFFRNKKWWNKYAGNWNESSPSFFYGLQQRILNLASHTNVSINGKWPGQKPHLFSMENPCLEDSDISSSRNEIKAFKGPPYSICFVGALNNDKGVPHIIEMLNKHEIRNKISRFYFVGNGHKKKQYQSMINDLTYIDFCGFKDAAGVHEILKQSDFIVLPSKSEGFPKVIAEASCYGCIPIVSDVSCIGQYINESTGYLWNMQYPFYELVSTALNEDRNVLIEKSNRMKSMAYLFTYSRFKERIFHILDIIPNPKSV